MSLMSESEMAQVVEKICAGVVRRSDEVDKSDLESFFDDRATQADFGELVEICRRVKYRCSVNGIALVQCDELLDKIQPWKIEYKVKIK